MKLLGRACVERDLGSLNVLIIAVALILQPAAAQDVLTYHNNKARTGVNLNETILTPSNVNVNTFGKLFFIPVDGKVDAQPLYKAGVSMPGKGIHNVLYVATENDSLYAFDADTGTVLWHRSLLLLGETPSDDRSCSQVSPKIGVTATPVIDPLAGANGTIYVVAMSKNSSGAYFQRLHALDLTTGGEEIGSPVSVHATFPGTGDNSSSGQVIFAPKQYKERPGLLLLNGVVYTTWASHCDRRPYTGWIIGYNELTLQQVSVLNITPNGLGGSIWTSGAAPAALANDLFVLAGNGTFDTTLNASGFPIKGDYGNGFVKVSTLNNELTVADYFEMFNTVSESSLDEDLGSGGVVVLPPMKDVSGTTRYLVVGAGKDRNIYLLDSSNMGKFHATSNKIYQELPGALAGREFGVPAYFNRNLYYGAVADVIRMLHFSNAKLAATPVSKTRHSFVYPGVTPSISANGTANAVLWAVESASPAVLRAYDATNLGRELYNSNQAVSGRDHFGGGNKFMVPTVANGKVFVGTPSGVAVFGLLR